MHPKALRASADRQEALFNELRALRPESEARDTVPPPATEPTPLPAPLPSKAKKSKKRVQTGGSSSKGDRLRGGFAPAAAPTAVPTAVPLPATTPPPPRSNTRRIKAPFMTPDELAAVSCDITAGGDAVRALLDQHGMAVVMNVTTPEENAAMEALWKNDLLTVAGDAMGPGHSEVIREQYRAVEREGVSRWPQASLFDPNDKFCFKRGLVHGAYAWSARLNPNVRKVYSWLHECPEEELCVGLDTVFFNPKPAVAEDDKYWMHVDYNNNLFPEGRECYQGFLYTWPSEDEESSTAVVWPGSHKVVNDRLQAAYTKGFCPPKNHLVHLKIPCEETRKDLVEGALQHARRIPMPAGALLIMSSKVSHQGWCVGRRLCALMCWEKKAWRAHDAYRRKMWLCANGIQSNHWASLGVIFTSQPDLLTEMSPSSDAAYEADGEHSLRMPLYPSIVPFTVRPDALQEWQRAVPKLWCGTAKQSGERFKDEKLLANILKPEVLEVL